MKIRTPHQIKFETFERGSQKVVDDRKKITSQFSIITNLLITQVQSQHQFQTFINKTNFYSAIKIEIFRRHQK